MDALNLAAANDPAPLHDSEGAFHEEARRLSPRIRAALIVLLEAYAYSQDVETSPWDFATEIASLRRFKLSNSDMRWLVGRRLVEHGVEVTLGSDEERTFQHPGRLMFCKKTCFVLSPTGVAFVRKLAHGGDPAALAEARAPAEPRSLGIARPAAPQPPTWDRDRQELRVGPTLVKRFKI